MLTNVGGPRFVVRRAGCVGRSYDAKDVTAVRWLPTQRYSVLFDCSSIRYPRLVALVRQLTRQTSDLLLRDEVVTLAKDLYDHSMEPIDAKHQLSPFYSTHRIMLCGVIQKLRDMGAATESDFNYAEVEKEEDKRADILSRMSSAFDSSRDPPWKATRLGTFAVIPYGAWCRIEERLVRTSGRREATERAAWMKGHCLQLQARYLGTASDSYPMEMQMKVISDLMIGGPLIPPSVYSPPPLEGVHKMFYNGLMELTELHNCRSKGLASVSENIQRC